jgi:hypothetical protein
LYDFLRKYNEISLRLKLKNVENTNRKVTCLVPKLQSITSATTIILVVHHKDFDFLLQSVYHLHLKVFGCFDSFWAKIATFSNVFMALAFIVEVVAV